RILIPNAHAMGALSKGCGSCKRRKVKCDENRPCCIRCCKAGIECTGFTPRLRFVDETPRIRRSLAASRAQSHKSSTPPSPAPLLADTLPLTAFRDDIFISYLFSKMFRGEYQHPLNATREIQCGLPTHWIPELVKTPQRPRQRSWDALAAIVFGQSHNSQDVMTHALKLYGQALSELRNKLSNPDDRCTESTLASMTALYIYEKTWMLHADGLGRLLEWRGPRQLKSYAEKSIFLEHRIILVAKSIVSHQRTFLHDPIWKTVPWEDNLASKSEIDYLVDIGTDIAEYISQLKRHRTSRGSQEFEYSRLRTQVATSLKELNNWWHQRETEHTQVATEVTSHWTANEPLFPTHLRYDTLWTAFAVCTYDAIRILLLQLWYTLQLFTSSIQTIDQEFVLDVPNRTALLGISSDTKGLAREILRSLNYSYGESRRFVCTFSFLFIQDIAYGCFDEGSKEAIWVAEHGWAELTNFDVEDANLLKRLLPPGQIKAGDVSLGSVGNAAHVLLTPTDQNF
ncbi:uncharacterized protein N7503_002593, partial [Penicillium pulvis]|uniref:uncharacterized protein n=1 Tax=Penicillium pulvis TaxID=1562058 RepID=UPI002547AFB5